MAIMGLSPGMVSNLAMVLLAVGVIGMLFSLLKPYLLKKKPKYIELPRDALERVVRNSKKPIKHGFGVQVKGVRIVFSGDELVEGHVGGEICAGILQNEEYILWVKPKWWYFWKRALRVLVEPEIITDFNGDECVIEGRDWMSLDDYHTYVIPCYGISNLERLNIFRSQNALARVLQQFDGDLKMDVDFIPKTSLRGTSALAFIELDKVTEMMRMTEEEVKKKHGITETKEDKGMLGMGGGGQQ